MKKTNYIGMFIECCMLMVHIRFSLLLKGSFLLFLLCALPELEVKAQDSFVDDKAETSFMYDEIPVLVIVEGYKNFTVDAIYANNDKLYVNVEELFRTLGILCTIGKNGDILSGYIENKSRSYYIDFNTKQVIVDAKTINMQKGLVKEMGSLYMESTLFEAFGLKLIFNYRAITIILKANFELPVLKQMRLENLRKNIAKLKGEVIADTVLKRDYHLFKAGMLDWSVASTQTGKGTSEIQGKGYIDNRFSLGVGTELLYGEADVSLYYYDRQKFDNRQLNYLWHWVDNDKSFIKQAQVGKIYTQSISSIYSPVIGASIRNSPTTVRKATGYYIINEFTEPNWTVELYINDIMVDYTKADASGLYVFKVPNVYGYNTLKLKFYGTLGEERTEERTRNVPYTVMSANEFEYGLSAGVVQDSTLARFGKAEFNYGLNRLMTIGGGLEYLSSITNGAYIPYLTATIQPFSKLTLNGEYAYGVRSKGLMNYYFRQDILLEVDYTKYVEGQLANRFNALEERNIRLSFPFKFKKFVGFSRLDYTQYVYKLFNYNQSSVMFSSYYKQLSANLSTQLNWIDKMPAYVTSNLALSYRLKKGLTIRPSTQYNVSANNLISCKVDIEKSIPKGNVSVSYERSMMYHSNFITLNFKYDLSFARTNMSASQNNGSFYTAQNAQGSLALGSGNKYMHISNNASVSRGGISLYPFLDLNHNGVFDKDEHMVKLTTVRAMGGKVIFSEKDSIIRIPELNAFTKYVVEFKDSDLKNIAWRFTHKIYEVLIDPNQFRRVDIPIIVVGEVSGMAYLNNDETKKGIARILIKIYKKNSIKVVAETMSEFDGYINYIGLAPGEYVARIDSVQLSNLDYTVDHPYIDFTIKRSDDGDIVAGLDFVLSSKQDKSLNKKNIVVEPITVIPENAVKKLPLPTKPVVMIEQKKVPPTIDTDMPIEQKKETPSNDSVMLKKQDKITLLPTNPTRLIVKEKESKPTKPVTMKEQKKLLPPDLDTSRQPQAMNKYAEKVLIEKDTTKYVKGAMLYHVQLLALRKPVQVNNYFKNLLALVPGLKIAVTLGKDGIYRYTTVAFSDKMAAREFLRLIRKSGFPSGFVNKYDGEKCEEMMYRLQQKKK